MKLDILAFGAHPDDVELGCSGTLAKEIAAGKKVGIVDLTRGELGTRGSAELRAQEAQAAADLLGVSYRHNLGFSDGFFTNNKDNQLEVIKQIRAFQPEIVFCNAIRDRHIDHGKGSKLVSDACFLSGLRKIETQWKGKPQAAWRPRLVLHYIQWQEITPDIILDIGAHIETKIKAVKAYGSQFYQAHANEPETPISSTNFLDSVTYRAQNLGRLIGTDYAEGFTSDRPIAVNSAFDLI